MPDRCLSLSDDEVRRLLAGASVVVRPIKTGRYARKVVCTHDPRFWTVVDEYGFGLAVKAPLAPGDTMVAREAWRGVFGANGIGVQYRADRVVQWRPSGDVFGPLYTPDSNDSWRTPQTMPAVLARIRRRVGSVEAVGFGKVSEETFRAAGFNVEWAAFRAREWWLSRYGPGSRSGWVWVMEVSDE